MEWRGLIRIQRDGKRQVIIIDCLIDWYNLCYLYLLSSLRWSINKKGITSMSLFVMSSIFVHFPQLYYAQSNKTFQ